MFHPAEDKPPGARNIASHRLNRQMKITMHYRTQKLTDHLGSMITVLRPADERLGDRNIASPRLKNTSGDMSPAHLALKDEALRQIPASPVKDDEFRANPDSPVWSWREHGREDHSPSSPSLTTNEWKSEH